MVNAVKLIFSLIDLYFLLGFGSLVQCSSLAPLKSSFYNLFFEILDYCQKHGAAPNNSGIEGIFFPPAIVGYRYELFDASTDFQMGNFSPAVNQRLAHDMVFIVDRCGIGHDPLILNRAHQVADAIHEPQGRPVEEIKQEFISYFMNLLQLVARESLESGPSIEAKKLTNTEINIHHSIFVDALVLVADSLSADQVAQISRIVPDLLKMNYELVEKITDFSNLDLDDLERISDPVNHFSLHRFPNALKTLSWEGLMWVLDAVEFDIGALAAEQLISIRGPASFIQNKEFVADARSFIVFNHFTLDHFKAAAAEINEQNDDANMIDGVNLFIQFKVDFFSSVLNETHWLRLSLKQRKFVALALLIDLELRRIRVFQNIYKAMTETKEAFPSANEGEVSALVKASFDVLKKNMKERADLLNFLSNQPNSLHCDLFHIPIDSLSRDSWYCVSTSNSRCFPDYPEVTAANGPKRLLVYQWIWKYFNVLFADEKIAFNNSEILSQYSHPNQHLVLQAWTAYTAVDQMKHLPRAFNASIMLAMLMHELDVPNHPEKKLKLEIVKLLQNRLADIDCSKVTLRLNVPEATLDQKIFLSVEVLSIKFVESQLEFAKTRTSDIDAFSNLRKLQLKLRNRFRALSHSLQKKFLAHSLAKGNSFSSAIAQDPDILPMALYKALSEEDHGTDGFSKTFRNNSIVTFGLSSYGSLDSNELEYFSPSLDLLLRGAHTISTELAFEWASFRDGIMNSPIRFFECSNSAIFNVKDAKNPKLPYIMRVAPLSVAQSVYPAIRHQLEFGEKVLNLAASFPDLLETLILEDANWAELINLVIRWYVSWEMNFRSFQIATRKKSGENEFVINFTRLYCKVLKSELLIKNRVLSILQEFFDHNSSSMDADEQEIMEKVLYCLRNFIGAPERIRFFITQRNNEKFLNFNQDLKSELVAVVDEYYGSHVAACNPLGISSIIGAGSELETLIAHLSTESSSYLLFLNDVLGLYFPPNSLEKFTWNTRFIIIQLVDNPFETNLSEFGKKVAIENAILSLEHGKIPYNDALMLATTLMMTHSSYWTHGVLGRQYQFITQFSQFHKIRRLNV